MNSTNCKVYTLNSPKNLFLKDEQILTNKTEDYIIGETIYSCISPGTEVAAYSGMPPLVPGNQYPRVNGYCNVAKVIEKGDKFKNISIGDNILTFQSHRDKFILNSSDFYIILPENINLKSASTSYLFHLGYHSLITADIKQGHTVGVIGAGVLGTATAIMSNIAGSKTYLFTNQNILDKKGIYKNINICKKNDVSIKHAIEEVSVTGFDIIINSSNSWSDWLIALKLIRKGGVIVNLGFPGRGEKLPAFNPLDPNYFYKKNITIKALCTLNEEDVKVEDARFNIKRNLYYIIDLIESGKIKSDDLLTEEISYLELENQYKKYLDRKSQMLSTLIKWIN